MILDLAKPVPSQKLLGDVSRGINTLSRGTAQSSTSALLCPLPASPPELGIFREPKYDLLCLCCKSLMFHFTLELVSPCCAWGNCMCPSGKESSETIQGYRWCSNHLCCLACSHSVSMTPSQSWEAHNRCVIRTIYWHLTLNHASPNKDSWILALPRHTGRQNT